MGAWVYIPEQNELPKVPTQIEIDTLSPMYFDVFAMYVMLHRLWIRAKPKFNIYNNIMLPSVCVKKHSKN